MRPVEIDDAVAVVVGVLDALAVQPATGGRPAADLRRLAGALRVDAEAAVRQAALGGRLAALFAAASAAGFGLTQWRRVRRDLVALDPGHAPGAAIAGAAVQLALAQEAAIVAAASFRSRDQVERLQARMAAAFDAAVEDAADDRDAETVNALTAAHAALTRFLAERARPLPQIVRYSMPRRLPAVVVAHRLYQDAGRAGELIAENGIVHPAFVPSSGRALSR